MFPDSGTITDEARFKNADNALYDPTTVTLEVRDPNGTISNPSVTNISTGVYRANITLSRGVTRWVWDGVTGGVHDKIDGWACAAEELTA